MKKKIIVLISGAVILIIAAGSIYGKSESGHKEGEPDVVGTFSVNRDENITVVANRGHIGDKEAFARELLQMYKDDSFYSTKFSTDRGYATSLDMNIYLWKEDIEDGESVMTVRLRWIIFLLWERQAVTECMEQTGWQAIRCWRVWCLRSVRQRKLEENRYEYNYNDTSGRSSDPGGFKRRYFQ